MKKVAIIRYNLSKIGGAERVAINMANELAEFYEVFLLSITLDESQRIHYPIHDKVNFRTLMTGEVRVRKALITAVSKLRKFLKKEKIKIVFSIAPQTNIIIWLATLGLGIKTVFCDHHSLDFQDLKSRKIQRYIGAKFFNKVITLTEKDKFRYPIDFKISQKKVDFIYNWMESTEKKRGYRSSSKKLITVGRFDSQKGYDYLSRVAVNVLSEYPDWQWDIYGSGEESIKIKLIEELEKGKVLSQVNFMGNVKGIENIYPNHAIYIMTSRYEGLPLVLLEAKQYGLPIVSFDCPTGPSEIILDGENGYLIENFDVKQMSQKIIELIENDELRLRFSRNAMLDTDKFNKKRIIEQWIELIEEMTGE